MIPFAMFFCHLWLISPIFASPDLRDSQPRDAAPAASSSPTPGKFPFRGQGNLIPLLNSGTTYGYINSYGYWFADSVPPTVFTATQQGTNPYIVSIEADGRYCSMANAGGVFDCHSGFVTMTAGEYLGGPGENLFNAAKLPTMEQKEAVFGGYPKDPGVNFKITWNPA